MSASTNGTNAKAAAKGPQRDASGAYSSWQVFKAPVWLGVFSVVGLISALLGDDVWDLLSWLTLLAPLAVIGWFYWRARQTAGPATRVREERQ